jgi:D-aminoacyl-tRNA deacylase
MRFAPGPRSKSFAAPELPSKGLFDSSEDELAALAKGGTVGSARYLVVVSEPDPVAPRVAERWGTPASEGEFVDGAPLRRLSPGVLVVKRPALHIHDERLDARLPKSLQERGITMVFPSVHRSEQNVACLTVHPLGNPGAESEVGGRPESWVPSDPPLMVAALRALAESAPSIGLAASYEATHHGPYLELPAFFAEIGFGTAPGPDDEAVRVLADALANLTPVEGDRVALAVGGGHYAPHFTDLALRRRWAFGHLVSRHAFEVMSGASARAAYDAVPRAEGIVFSRAEDARRPIWEGLGRRLREQDASRRDPASLSDAARPASGT